MTELVFDAVILSGGRGTRLGNVEKATVQLAGETLIERTVRAANRAGAQKTIYVGEDIEALGGCLRAREDPPFSGPLAGLKAGLSLVQNDWILLLACDLVRPEEAVKSLLRVATKSVPGATMKSQLSTPTELQPDTEALVLVDESGQAQWLTSLLNTAALKRALTGEEVAGKSLKSIFKKLQTQYSSVENAFIEDIDTPEALAAAKQKLEKDV